MGAGPGLNYFQAPANCPKPEPTPSPDPTCEAFTVIPHSAELSGADTLTTAGTGVQSISVYARAVGGTGTATITTESGTIDLAQGDTFTWSVDRAQDDHVGSLTVETTDAGDDVLVTWTEAV